MANKADEITLTKVLNDLGESETFHQTFLERAESGYNAYRGIMEKRSEAAAWTSKLHPPYAHQIGETLVANLVEEKLRFRVIGRPRLANPEEIQTIRGGARALELLLSFYLDIDKLAQKQRTIALQAFITGLTVGKCYWKTKQTMGHPTLDPVDVRDFIWPESAISLEAAPWVAHRVWRTIEDLKKLEEEGIYKNVRDLGEGKSRSSEWSIREQRLYGADRTRNRIEVIEYWTPERVITIAEKSVVLADRDNPFDFSHLGHNYPFVIGSSQPEMFMIPGVSEIEIISQLQEMLWLLINQRIDTITLINNAIMLIRSDVDDPDEFEFGPGQRWLVESPDQVRWFQPDPQVGNISLMSEQLLKGDIQNITGGMPFLAGTTSQEMDQKTATGVSIITSLAQKRLNHKKQQFMWFYENVADLWVTLIAHYAPLSELVEIIGEDGAVRYAEVFPPVDPTPYKVKIDPVQESVLRQERRAEALTLMTTFAQFAPILASIGTPINLRAFAEDALKSFDKDDIDRYFSAIPQAPMTGENPARRQQPLGATTQPGTFTSPQAVSPLAPSNPMSLSPEVFLQRLMTQRGGANNKSF